MGWFTKKAAAPIRLEAIVAPAGSTVVLRSPQILSQEQREQVTSLLKERSKTDGIRFVLLDGEWEAVVIGAPE